MTSVTSCRLFVRRIKSLIWSTNLQVSADPPEDVVDTVSGQQGDKHILQTDRNRQTDRQADRNRQTDRQEPGYTQEILNYSLIRRHRAAGLMVSVGSLSCQWTSELLCDNVSSSLVCTRPVWHLLSSIHGDGQAVWHQAGRLVFLHQPNWHHRNTDLQIHETRIINNLNNLVWTLLDWSQ